MAGGRKTPKWERNRVTGSGDGGKSEGCRGERQGCKEETRDAGGEPGMGGGGGAGLQSGEQLPLGLGCVKSR